MKTEKQRAKERDKGQRSTKRTHEGVEEDQIRDARRKTCPVGASEKWSPNKLGKTKKKKSEKSPLQK